MNPTTGTPLAVPAQELLDLRYTIFKDRFGAAKSTQSTTWPQLVEHLKKPPVFQAKADMPLLKMATFGNERTPKGSRRHDSNLLMVTGVEGDYDGGLVSAEEAKRRLEAHGIRAVVYTTPSFDPNEPRWRVIAPLSAPHQPAQREALARLLDNILGNILARESFVLSQAFYFGRIENREYRCLVTFDDPEAGAYLDQLQVKPAISTFTAKSRVSPLTQMLAQEPLYRSADELVRQLGRLLVTGDGRRELLKSYIASKSAKGMKPFEVRSLVDGFAKQYFDPNDPANDHDVDAIIDWATQRDAPIRSQLAIMDSARQLHAKPIVAGEDRIIRFDPADGVVQVPTTYPPPRQYVFAETVTPGTVCVIAGSGGSSKTMLIMQACVAAASGISMGSVQVAEGASLLFLGEEDSAERDRRIGGICEHLKANTSLVEKRMRCFPAAGRDIRLTTTYSDGAPNEAPLADEVVAHAEELSRTSDVPVTMIVIDHARLAMAGDPNNAEHVTQLTRVLTSIAQRTGAAVFLLAHSPKSVMSKEGSEINAADVAGSSAFVDNGRSAFMLYSMRENEAKEYDLQGNDRSDYVCLLNVKTNYAAEGARRWFERAVLPDWGVAVLQSVLLFPAVSTGSASRVSLRRRILDVLRAKPGGVSIRALRDKSGKDGPLGASEKAVRTEIDEMISSGEVLQRPPTAEERRIHRLGGQVREVLVPAE
jgi:hypothetical protein